MLSIATVTRAEKGHDGPMRDSLLDLATNAQANELATIGFFQDFGDACVITT